jgi:hypothetical protein
LMLTIPVCTPARKAWRSSSVMAMLDMAGP